MLRWALTGLGAIALIATAAPPPAMAQTVVKVWLHDHPPRVPIDRRVFAEFERTHPDVRIQYEVIPVAEYNQKLLTAFAAGTGPDLFAQVSLLVAQYQAARILAPVDFEALGYANEAALTGEYLTGFDGIRFGGRLYGVPTEVSNWTCFANNALWREAGLDPARDFPRTWEALPAVIERLTRRDANGVPTRRGLDFNWGNRNQLWFTTSSMMHQLGANVVDDASGQVTLDSPAGRRTMQYVADFVNRHRLGGPQYTDPRADFLAGRLATECSFGIFGIPQFRAANIDFTALPLPRWADATSDNGYDAYAYYQMVNARSPAATQRIAWQITRAFIDSAPERFTGAGLFVPRREVMTTPAYLGDPAIAVVVGELRKARFSPGIPGYDQVLDVMIRGRDQIVQGGRPVAEVLPTISQEMNTVLARARARSGPQ
jgi:multiple sugar transport system substrate-binding protein